MSPLEISAQIHERLKGRVQVRFPWLWLEPLLDFRV